MITTYRGDPSSMKMLTTRTNRPRYSPYLPGGVTTSSNSVGGQLSHLSSQPHPFQYWQATSPYTPTTLHQPSLHQSTTSRHPQGSQVLPQQQSSVLSTGISPSLAGSPGILPGHPSPIGYDYSTVPSTAATPSYNASQPPLQQSPTMDRLPSQAAYSPQESSAYGSPQISQAQQPQHWSQPAYP